MVAKNRSIQAKQGIPRQQSAPQPRTLPPPQKPDTLAVVVPRTPTDWAALVLRLFLGISFLIAGLDKLGDPSYLDPTASGYIGHQIAQFAPGTPLEGFLLGTAVPNATLFGVMVMGGEICIGLGALLGILTRFSAAMGLLLNLTFFLSATWDVHPFYFGADLPYTFAWLALLIVGSGSLALDPLLKRWLAERPQPRSIQANESWLDTPLGRRAFITGAAAGLATLMLAATGVEWGLLHSQAKGAQANTAGLPSSGPPQPGAPATSAPVSSTPTAAQPQTQAQATAAAEPPTPTAVQAAAPPAPPAPPPASGALIAPPNSLPPGQALDFILPNGDPAVLVRTDAGYSAYVAVCTHEGCQVSYVAQRKLIGCPCHGALFDPASGGQAVRGPARRPLSPVAVTVGSDGGVYLNE